MPNPIRSLFVALGFAVGFSASSVYADAVEDTFSTAISRKQNNEADEAALSFKTIALEHPEHPLAERAVHEYFEILAPKLEAPGYAVADETNDVTALFVEALCKRSTNAKACAQVEALHCSVMRLQAERRIKDHDGTSDADRTIVKQAGDIYLGIWKRYGANSAAKKACRIDEVLFNAAYAYRHGGDQQAAVATYELLIDPQHGFLATPLAHRALYDLAQWHTLVAEFPEAIARFDQFATVAPKDERARDALYNALVLRLHTGFVDEALKNAETVLDLFNPTRKYEATTMILEVAETLVLRGEYQKAKTWLDKTMRRVQQDGIFEQKLFVVGLLGKALEGLGDQKGASKQYQGLFASAKSSGWLASDPGGKESVLAINSAWVWKALDAVTHASIFLIRLEGTDTRRIPVSKTIKTMQEAINLRAEVIERAMFHYGKPMEALSKQPATLKVGISAVMAGHWIAMAEEIDRGIDAMKKAKATRDDVRAVEKAAEGVMDSAKRQAHACMQQAIAQQQYSDETNRCRQWLERRYPKEFRVIEELTPGLRAPMESAIVSGKTSLANPQMTAANNDTNSHSFTRFRPDGAAP